MCSQGPCSGTVLQEEPWQQMLTDLGSQSPGREVLDILNIASIKRKGAARLLVGRKVPFLAAVLHHIDVSSADPVVVLRDHTGLCVCVELFQLCKYNKYDAESQNGYRSYYSKHL